MLGLAVFFLILALVAGALGLFNVTAGLLLPDHPIEAMQRSGQTLSDGETGGPFDEPYRGPSALEGLSGQHPQETGRPSWLSRLAHQFAPEAQQLKSLAIGTALGLARDAVRQSAPPNLAPKLVNLIDQVTEKLGGQHIEGPVMQSSERT